MKPIKIVIWAIAMMVLGSAYAQEFEANMQLKPRYEFRNGYKAPIPYGETAAQFISSRTRLNLNFKQDQFVTKLSIQNVRVWGDVAPNTKSDVNGIQLFEAWVQYNLNANWSGRVGRQVLSYDNQRILGAGDWAMQAQSHDAAVVTYKKNKDQLDLGLSYSALAETDLAVPYTVANYKSMQYAWYHKEQGKLNFSLLFLNTGYENKLTPPIPSPTPKLTVDYMQTFGTYLSSKTKLLDASLWFYGQTGKNNKSEVSAFDAALNMNYALSATFKAGIGYEFLSGKSQEDKSTAIKSFSPLFGTNHAFNGYMDYFYVGNHKNSVGLQDAFLKFAYEKGKWQLGLMPHLFYAANTVIDANNSTMDNYLGTEIDLTFGYAVHKFVNMSGGYSQMYGSDTMQRLKGGDVDHTNNWAWLSVNVNPRLFLFK